MWTDFSLSVDCLDFFDLTSILTTITEHIWESWLSNALRKNVCSRTSARFPPYQRTYLWSMRPVRSLRLAQSWSLSQLYERIQSTMEFFKCLSRAEAFFYLNSLLCFATITFILVILYKYDYIHDANTEHVFVKRSVVKTSTKRTENAGQPPLEIDISKIK